MAGMGKLKKKYQNNCLEIEKKISTQITIHNLLALLKNCVLN